MVQFRLYFDKDKETKWLNEMAAQGWAMKSFFAGFYTFEECEKGKYQYQVDFGDQFMNISDDYKEFMKENDIEIVQRWGFWVILRKAVTDGDFVLYTDVDSQISHYTKILRMFQGVTIFEFLLLLFEIWNASQLEGIMVWAPVFLMMAIIIVFVNCIVNTKNVLGELEERKTGIKKTKKTSLSPLLMVGMLFNACAVTMEGDGLLSTVKLIIQILAIIFMLTGIYTTLSNVKKQASEQN